MPSEHGSAAACTEPTSATLQRWPAARLANGELDFDQPGGFEAALHCGFFLIDAPEPPIDLSAGDAFARNFPYGPIGGVDYRTLREDRLGAHQGYFSRQVDQTEQFFLEAANWQAHYPPPLVRQAHAMRQFAWDILRAVLAQLPLDQLDLDQATGHALTPQGTHTLTFNHFRPECDCRGLNVHKDSGWVTVLRSLRPGLEVYVDGVWCPLDPVAGKFIVNFGCAMEILTRQLPTPVTAASHRVVQQYAVPDLENRFSYALFVDSTLDPALSPGLMTVDAAGQLRVFCSFAEFLSQILEKTYGEETRGLY